MSAEDQRAPGASDPSTNGGVAAPSTLPRPSVVAILEAAGLGSASARALALLEEPVIRLKRRAAGKTSLPLGVSRLGGTPDAPRSFEWPKREGRPLRFVAQLDLAALPAGSHGPLPTEGSLAFFLDPEAFSVDPADRGRWRIEWWRTAYGPLAPVKPPGKIKSYKPCTLEFEVETKLPSALDDRVREMSLSNEDWKAYSSFFATCEGMVSGDRARPVHHLLGPPTLAQADPRAAIELAFSRRDFDEWTWRSELKRLDVLPYADQHAMAEPWILLLQLDQDERGGPGFTWGDSGKVLFYVRPDPTAKSPVLSSWMVRQSF